MTSPKSWFSSRKTHASRYSQRNEGDVENCILGNLGLLNKPGIAVDIGAGDGKTLSNVLHLKEDHWWQLIMFDGKPQKPESLVKQVWITRENANEILDEHHVPYDPDLFSLDLDGNDYWVWETILEKRKPKVIVTEVNGCLSPESRLTIAYNPEHKWNHDDYYGASFGAFEDLFKKHGYIYLGHVASTNIFFVRRDLATDTMLAHIPARPRKVQYHKHQKNAHWVSVANRHVPKKTAIA